MQRGRRAVISDIGRQPPLGGGGVDGGRVGRLVDEAALGEHAQEVGSERGHRRQVHLGTAAV